ncbi:MAG: putative nucleotidyltransferase substrate binding domain-containing protein [Thermocrinis sp.]|jgi:CBS domain-containing protein|uniref:putative nucleotidyltransferase substrate binding domain-containing protein n=1 Tax=Thermocrinis sp. TaxID=2024383 RepID=UPI003C048409
MLDAERFLREHEPFNLLTPEVLRSVVYNLQVQYYQKDEVIFQEGSAPLSSLYIVRKGVVLLKRGSEVLDYLQEGDSFGFVSLLTGGRPSSTAIAYEDALLFLLPDKVFKKLCKDFEAFNQYFLRKLTGRFEKRKEESSSLLERLARVQVKDLNPRDVPIVEENDNIDQIINLMAKADHRAVLVKFKDGYGIITERDIIKRVLGEGKDPKETKAVEVATFPIIGVDERDYLIDVLTLMSKHAIRRVVVFSNQQPSGILEDRDIILYESKNFVFLFKEIERAKDEESLAFLYRQTTKAVVELVLEGADPERVGKYVSELNDRFMRRAVFLTISRLGEEPLVPFCILVLGSEGRQEQSLKTDQDNALIYRDLPIIDFDAKEYFKRFSEEYIKVLLKVGFPPCPGNVMVSNPEWRGSEKEWEKRVSSWIDTPVPENVLNSAIFFDFRSVFGDKTLADGLEEYVHKKIRGKSLFMGYFVSEGLKFKPPLTFFKGFVVERGGEHKGKLDLKKGGIFPITHGVRCLSLFNGILERNTYDRMRVLMERGILEKNFGRDLLEAYRFLNMLRFREQADKVIKGKEPDNYIDPEKLSKQERGLLKDAFRVVENFQEFLRHSFGSVLLE